MFKNIKKQAFTLAEVLIVLAVLGVIAAVTVPGLMSRINPEEKQLEISYKKNYGIIESATRMIMTDSDDFSLVNLCSSEAADKSKCVRDKYARFINFSKTCDANSEECFKAYNTYPTAISSDGTLYAFQHISDACDGSAKTLYTPTKFTKTNSEGVEKSVSNICWTIYVDLNGEKVPDTLKKDIYEIPIGK